MCSLIVAGSLLVNVDSVSLLTKPVPGSPSAVNRVGADGWR